MERHVNKHRPAGATVTFKTLGFKAFPYKMPKDTVVNQAAAKVSIRQNTKRLHVNHARS